MLFLVEIDKRPVVWFNCYNGLKLSSFKGIGKPKRLMGDAMHFMTIF